MAGDMPGHARPTVAALTRDPLAAAAIAGAAAWAQRRPVCTCPHPHGSAQASAWTGAYLSAAAGTTTANTSAGRNPAT